MSDDNSSSDEELVVGHLFDDLFDNLFDESGSDSSDDSSSDDSSSDDSSSDDSSSDDSSSDDSSSDDSRGSDQAMGPLAFAGLAWPLGPQPMLQGPLHLASDPRYVWSDQSLLSRPHDINAICTAESMIKLLVILLL